MIETHFKQNGYTTEGAKACLDYGFNELKLDRVYSFTAVINEQSENVMNKIGLKKIGSFLHPREEDDSPLKSHVLYKIDKNQVRL